MLKVLIFEFYLNGIRGSIEDVFGLKSIVLVVVYLYLYYLYGCKFVYFFVLDDDIKVFFY